MASLCERMYPNYVHYCEATGFAEPQTYRVILDSIWELLTVKNAKINFERQLEKLEEMIPELDDDSIYLTYPAIDACVALSTCLVDNNGNNSFIAKWANFSDFKEFTASLNNS